MSRRFSFGPEHLFAACALAGLAACQGIEPNDRGGFVIPPDLGLNSLMALPRPFQAKDKSLLALMQTADGENDVALPPVAGLSQSDNRRLVAAVASAADGYDILVLDALPDRRTHVLEGIASRAPGQVLVKWYLRNGYGELVKSFEVGAQAPEGASGLGGAAIRALAEPTAAGIAQSLAMAAGAARAVRGADPASAASTAPPAIRIGAVTGAPGDGGVALPVALHTMLEQDGVRIAQDGTPADFTLLADIAHEPAPGGMESFAITWRVLNRSGQPAGEIRQANKIRAGSLDGAWGATAYDIALGAQGGLYQLLGEIEMRETGAEGTAPPEAGPVIPRSVLDR
jgi:hypothetical protein